MLRCAREFTFTHVYVSGPGKRCTEPIRSGLVFISDEPPQPDSLQTKRFDSMSASELRLACARPNELSLSAATPACYLETDAESRDCEVELATWWEGRFIHVKLLETHSKEQENVDVAILAFVGFWGRRKARQPKVPYGPWIHRSCRQSSVHPHELRSVFSPGDWVCDGRDYSGGCRSGQTDFHQTSVYTATFRCHACGFDLCERCAQDPTLGRVSESSLRADLDALADPNSCRLACTRLRKQWERDWLRALLLYFRSGLLETLRTILQGGEPPTSASRPNGSGSGVLRALENAGDDRAPEMAVAAVVAALPGSGSGQANSASHRERGTSSSFPAQAEGSQRGRPSSSRTSEAERKLTRRMLLQLTQDLTRRLFGSCYGSLKHGDPVWARSSVSSPEPSAVQKELRPPEGHVAAMDEEHWEEGVVVRLPGECGARKSDEVSPALGELSPDCKSKQSKTGENKTKLDKSSARLYSAKGGMAKIEDIIRGLETGITSRRGHEECLKASMDFDVSAQAVADAIQVCDGNFFAVAANTCLKSKQRKFDSARSLETNKLAWCNSRILCLFDL